MVRTRFAPSPTGNIHIGGLRTALYAYALAKHSGGEFILRIEDTDKKREIAGSQEKIQLILKQFGLLWNNYFVQSERVVSRVYRNAAEKLVKDGHGYIDEGAIRIKIPENEKVSYHDFVLDKKIEWDSNTLEDLVILKSDGFPTYHLAVVVDDHDMEISHVLRGHDWMPSTPIHILLYKYLDYEMPQIGHLTDILDPDGGKLSKRKGSVSVEGMLGQGYLPEALLNFVMLLGWAPKDNKEFFTLDEFVKAFDAKGFQKSNPVFNRDKLDWFNGEYLRKLTDENLAARISVFVPNLDKKIVGTVTPLIKDRIKKLTDVTYLLEFFVKKPKVDKMLLGKSYSLHLSEALNVIKNLDNFSVDELNTKFMELIKTKKFKTGDFFMDLRVVITGKKITPPINESMIILGRQESIERIKAVLS